LGKLAIALNPYHHYVKAAELALFRSSRLRAVICNSKMVKEEIMRHFHLAEDKLQVIYSGVDTHSFHPAVKRHRRAIRARYAIPEAATLLLFVGSGFERKGLDAVLQALAGLPADVHVMVVGRDKKSQRYQSTASRLGIVGRVHFVGRQQDVEPFYGAGDGLVLPTLYDPFPNVVLGAMACGLPVITSLKCGAAEIIQDGVSGYVCDALDIPRLRQCMQQLSSPPLQKTLAAAARETVEAMDLERMSAALVALYRRLLATSAQTKSKARA
jgi:UDP-glucose:(heptosyl)LPS alpha-1,3-glucosyltransferase